MDSTDWTEPASRWRIAIGATVLGILAILLIYHETVWSMVSIWLRSETFAHGFLIFPISLWLIWRLREDVGRFNPAVDFRALPMFLACGLLWLTAHLAGVLVVEQYALVLMIPTLVWLLMSGKIAWELAFPLSFLLFAVPNGDFLVPPMMDFTADFTVKLLQITGIPVYREGTFFSIPSGDWSVVEGCSGLRYFIASITLGFLYAYLTYRSMWRRLAFIALAIVFPVIANGLRAYMIVMIAHLSDMQLALGVDHFIYGWVFFGLVMMLLFWLGSLMADQAPPEPVRTSSGPESHPVQPNERAAFAAALGLALVFSVLWPVRAAYIDELAQARDAAVGLELPAHFGAWRATGPATDWMPYYVQPDAEFEQAYTDGTHTVTLFVEYYRSQTQGEELVNSRNVLVLQKHDVWRMPFENPVPARLNGAPAMVRQGLLESPKQHLLTWRWNRFGRDYTISSLRGKLLEGRDKFLGNMRDAVGIVVATEAGEDAQAAAAVLQTFLDALLPVLEERLDQAAKEVKP